jgi:hypothetical protein|tara:strand:- start:3375 stop:3977 length:603 start_codon:yes stop_codon:yes gene_type:complete
MSKELLIETNLFQPVKGLISEGKTSDRGLPLVEGILATAEVKNGNGRYYPKALWEREISKYMESVKENRALGELDHPETTVINLKNVSHNITDIWWNGDNIMGKIEILPTPSGNILKALIESNITVGVSSRGTGSLKQGSSVLEVQDDFDLLCWDFVSTPSNPGSYMEVLKEGIEVPTKDYSKANKIIQEILCNFGSCPI